MHSRPARTVFEASTCPGRSRSGERGSTSAPANIRGKRTSGSGSARNRVRSSGSNHQPKQTGFAKRLRCGPSSIHHGRPGGKRSAAQLGVAKRGGKVGWGSAQATGGVTTLTFCVAILGCHLNGKGNPEKWCRSRQRRRSRPKCRGSWLGVALMTLFARGISLWVQHRLAANPRTLRRSSGTGRLHMYYMLALMGMYTLSLYLFGWGWAVQAGLPQLVAAAHNALHAHYHSNG